MNNNYYIVRNGIQEGPFTTEELRTKQITPETMVWTEGMTDWQPARQIPELSELLATIPPTFEGSSTDTQAPQSMNTMPPSYLVWSILVTILCCLPGGIISIIYAAQVSSKFRMNDYEGALDASKNAKKWAIISAIIGFVVLIANLAFLIYRVSQGDLEYYDTYYDF